MQKGQQNYGVSEGPATVVGTRDERTWSMLSHLSIFLNLLTGFLGSVAALIVWLVYRDRSQKAAFQALQPTVYQEGMARDTGRRMDTPSGIPDDPFEVRVEHAQHLLFPETPH